MNRELKHWLIIICLGIFAFLLNKYSKPNGFHKEDVPTFDDRRFGWYEEGKPPTLLNSHTYLGQSRNIKLAGEDNDDNDLSIYYNNINVIDGAATQDIISYADTDFYYLYISTEEPTSSFEGRPWYNSNGERCIGSAPATSEQEIVDTFEYETNRVTSRVIQKKGTQAISSMNPKGDWQIQ